MVNINLVCQSVPKEPLQARVSRGAVATVITACGFVTLQLLLQCVCFGDCVATVITACGFVTTSSLIQKLLEFLVATVITACGFVTNNSANVYCNIYGCNSDYRLRFCNFDNPSRQLLEGIVATVITACGFVTFAIAYKGADKAIGLQQ